MAGALSGHDSGVRGQEHVIALYRDEYGGDDKLVGLFTTKEKAADYIKRNCPMKCEKSHDRLWRYDELPPIQLTDRGEFDAKYQEWVKEFCDHTWNYSEEPMELDP